MILTLLWTGLAGPSLHVDVFNTESRAAHLLMNAPGSCAAGMNIVSMPRINTVEDGKDQRTGTHEITRDWPKMLVEEHNPVWTMHVMMHDCYLSFKFTEDEVILWMSLVWKVKRIELGSTGSPTWTGSGVEPSNQSANSRYSRSSILTAGGSCKVHGVPGLGSSRMCSEPDLCSGFVQLTSPHRHVGASIGRSLLVL